MIEIARILQGTCAASVQRPLGDLRWLCVILGICVPNMYNYSFLIEMDTRSWCSRSDIVAQYLCHFMGTTYAQCDKLVIAVQGPTFIPRGSSCFFLLFQNDHLKSSPHDNLCLGAV